MEIKENTTLGENGREEDEKFMRDAIRLSRLAVEHGNEPFGAVLVKNGEIVFSNENQIYTRNFVHRLPLQIYVNIHCIPVVNHVLCAAGRLSG